MTDEEKIKSAEIQLKAFLEKEGVEITYELGFPVYRIIPDEVKLALLVLAKHQMKVSIFLKKKQNK